MKANLSKRKAENDDQDRARKSAEKEKKDAKSKTYPAADDFGRIFDEDYFEKSCEGTHAKPDSANGELTFAGESAASEHRADAAKPSENGASKDSKIRGDTVCQSDSESEDENVVKRDSRDKISEAERKKRIRELKRVIRLFDAELRIIDFGGDPEKANLKDFIAEFID